MVLNGFNRFPIPFTKLRVTKSSKLNYGTLHFTRTIIAVTIYPFSQNLLTGPKSKTIVHLRGTTGFSLALDFPTTRPVDMEPNIDFTPL